MSNVAPLASPLRLSAVATWCLLLVATLAQGDPIPRELSAREQARVSEVALILSEQPLRARGAEWREGEQVVASGSQVRFRRYQLDLLEFATAEEAASWSAANAGTRFVHQEGTWVVTGFGPGLPAPEQLVALAKRTQPQPEVPGPEAPGTDAPSTESPSTEAPNPEAPGPEAPGGSEPAAQPPTAPSAQPVQPSDSAPARSPSIGIAGALRNARSGYSSPVLERGDRGASVGALQHLLNRNSSTQIAEDNAFGPATESALERFQREQGLPVTGVADQATWDRLRQPPEALRPSLRRGAKGHSVRALQELLNASRELRGLPKISEDGAFGGETERALREFQREHGISPSGEADDATWATLGGEDVVVATPEPTDYQSSPLLRRGHKGEPVRALHYLLNQHREAEGRPVLERDGDFGPATERALREFQREQGLPESGVTDPETWAALRTTPDQGARPAPLRRGDRGDDVAALQSRLNRHREPLRQSPIGVDGRFGSATEGAVRQFQGAQGLPQTGVVDGETLAGLNSEPEWDDPAAELPAPTGTGLSGLKIAIDSGHGVTGSGSFDPGAVNSATGLTEYELNRQVATRVASLLRAQGAQVTLQVYARGAPRRSLYDKGSVLARGHHVFVSIHHNAFNKRAQGSETLVHQSRGTTSSFALASAIQRHMVREIWGGSRSRDRGVKRAGLGVLRGAHSQVRTAVLVEGFFLDPQNVTAAVARDWVEREARAIAAGIAEHWSAR